LGALLPGCAWKLEQIGHDLADFPMFGFSGAPPESAGESSAYASLFIPN